MTRPPIVRDACQEVLAYVDGGATPSSRSVAYVLRAYGVAHPERDDVYRFLRTLEQLAAFDGCIDVANAPPREDSTDIHRSTIRHEYCALQELRAHVEACLQRGTDIRGRPAASREDVKKVLKSLLQHNFDKNIK